ncbi:hypothetical protein BH11PSE11_BH11PSE11_04030 [soil metagenome]
MTSFQRTPWLTALFLSMIWQSAEAQIIQPKPEMPSIPERKPADPNVAVPAQLPTRGFAIPPANIEPALDPGRGSQDSVATPSKKEAVQAVKDEVAPPGKPAQPVAATPVPSAAPPKEIVAIARDTSIIAASPGSPRLSQLQRLSKDEILAAVTDKFAAKFGAYVLKGNERAVVLDFPTALTQGRMFGRIIFFIERDGTPKTRVMSVAEVKTWLAKNNKTVESLTIGNNIRASEFARFFNTARFQGEPLTADEQDLYSWLLQMQLLREEDLGVSVVEPEAIIVSVPQISAVPGCAACSVSMEHRRVTVEHEFAHARFATDVPYQNYVTWFWSQTMNATARNKFLQFLRKRGYDTSIGDLVLNEMQAFLMHTPNQAVFSAGDVSMSEAELGELRQAFQQGLTPKPSLSAGRSYRLE